MRWRFLPVVNQDQEEATLIASPDGSAGSDPIVVDNETYINIYFDTSGSMNSTLAPLQEARNTLLHDALVPFYENNSSLYYSRVTFVEIPNERPFDWFAMNYGGARYNQFSANTKVVHLAFTDENSPYSQFAAQNSQMLTDANSMKFRIDNLPAGNADNYVAALFSVINSGVPAYQTNVKKLFENESPFAGTTVGNIVSDLVSENNLALMHRVPQEMSPQYYTDLIVSTLIGLGYTTG
jgi:hypothetical protein